LSERISRKLTNSRKYLLIKIKITQLDNKTITGLVLLITAVIAGFPTKSNLITLKVIMKVKIEQINFYSDLEDIEDIFDDNLDVGVDLDKNENELVSNHIEKVNFFFFFSRSLIFH
jgi:hypothetical protein